MSRMGLDHSRADHRQSNPDLSLERQRRRQSKCALHDQFGRQRYSRRDLPERRLRANAAQLATASAGALSAAIAQLHAAGGRYFVVPIFLGVSPVSSPSSTVAAVDRTYAQTLYANLAAAGVNFVPASGKVIADAIGVAPALFGLTNIAPGSSVTHQGGACVNPNPGSGAGGTIATGLVVHHSDFDVLIPSHSESASFRAARGFRCFWGRRVDVG